MSDDLDFDGADGSAHVSRKRFLGTAAALGLTPAGAAILSSCTSSSASNTKTPTKSGSGSGSGKFYAIAHSGPSDPYWAIEAKGVKAAGSDLGANAIFEGPPSFSISGEVDLFNAAVAANPDGIAVTLADPHALSGPINRAISKGITVILFNAQDFNHSTKTVGYVGQDETTSGERLATHLLPKLSSGDRAVVAIHQPGLSTLELRYNGIEKVLKPHGITVDKLNTGTDINGAIGIISSYFSRNPSTKAIATVGPLGTAPAAKYVTDHGLKGKVTIGAFDLDSVTLHYIKNGTVLGTIDQQPFYQGYQAIVQLVANKRYGMTPAVINTGTLWVTESNAAQLAALVKRGIGG